jgi:hypothetical protein
MSLVQTSDTDCKKRPQINPDYRSIQIHLRKHKFDSREVYVRSVLDKYVSICTTAKESGTIVPFQQDNMVHPKEKVWFV